MRTVLRCAITAVLMALAQQALAQPVNGCPAGQAMQSSDPSGRRVTCISVPDVDALTESSIVGKWAVTGSTTCLQSSTGFNTTGSTATFNPIIPSSGSASVSQLAGTFIGTRTFEANGTGRSVGTTHSVVFPATFHGAGFAGVTTNAGGASVATLDAGFTWRIQPDGTLFIDDDNTIPQPFSAPPSRVGGSATIVNVPPYVGHISKDKKTILLTHPGMSVETSTTRNPDGTTNPSIQRFCARSRVLTRLPN